MSMVSALVLLICSKYFYFTWSYERMHHFTWM